MSELTAKTSDKKGKSFGKNLLLLIISFILALVMWYLCTMQNEKVMAKKFTDIPVLFTNETVLEDKKLALLEDKELTVSVVVKGPISDISDIDKNNLYAVVDVSAANEEGTFLTTPVVEGLPSSVTANADTVSLQIERIITKYLIIDVEVVGTPAEGFTVTSENVVLGEQKVAVSCGSTLFKSVASAKIVVDTTDRSSSYNANLNIVILDHQGKVIDSDAVILDNDSVNVSVTVVKD